MDDARRAWLNWPNLPTPTRLALSRHALAERFAAVGHVMPNGLDTPTQLSRATELILPYYVPPSTYHGATIIPTFTIDTARRLVARPVITHAVAYGFREKRDSIGFHLSDEFYRLMNRLVWTKRSIGWTSRENPAVMEKNFIEAISSIQGDTTGTLINFTSQQDARDDADAIYDDPSYSGQNFRSDEEQSGRPYAHIGDTLEWIMLTEAYTSGFNRRYGYGEVTGIPNLIAHTCEMYVKTTFPEHDTSEPSPFNPDAVVKSTSVFDPAGDAAIKDCFAKFYEASGKVSSHKSEAYGSTGIPDWPDQIPELVMTPETQNSRHDIAAGYDVIDEAAVMKWNVTGGLRYVDWQA